MRFDVTAPSLDLRSRPASATDEPFLVRLHRQAMGPHVLAAWGSWDPQTQTRRMLKAPVERHDLLLVGGQPIGALLVERQQDAPLLDRIWIAPAHQGRGIGTLVIGQIVDAAQRLDVPVRLRVLRVNPAQRLYARLGFSVVETSQTHLTMERAPNSPSARGPLC